MATYNLELFGVNLRKIREGCHLTQGNVTNLCGVNRDTLRRIEQGLVIPKCETLEILSEVYKVDLLEELILSRVEAELNGFYRKIDDFLIDFEGMNQMNHQLSSDIRIKFKTEQPIYSMMYQQWDRALFHFINYFVSDTERALSGFIEEMHLSQPDFDLTHYQELHFSAFEYRLLTLMAMALTELKSYEKSSELLMFVLNQNKRKRLNTDNSVQLTIRIMHALSRNAFELNDYEKAIEFINCGIDLTMRHQTLFGLGALYFQRGRSKWALQQSSAYEDCKKAIQLMEIQGKDDMMIQYQMIVETMMAVGREEYLLTPKK